jgi:hypothetical protein
MKFPFSIFRKKPESSSKAPLARAQDMEPAAFPVERAVAQVQAETGLRFGASPSPVSDLQEATAVLTGQGVALVPTVISTPQRPEPFLEPSLTPTPTAEPPQRPQLLLPAAIEVADPVAVDAPVPLAGDAPMPSAAPSGVGRDEVVVAYRMFLRRDPESDTVIQPRLGIARERLLSTFMVSPEFLQRPENVKLLLEVAKSLEQRQPVPEPAPGVPVLTAQDVDAAKRIFWPDPHDQAIQPAPGESADRTLAQLMRSDHFQKNEFNANLVRSVARQIVQRLSQK